VDKQADFYADHIRIEDGQIYFDFHYLHNELHDIRLGVPVMVNIENSVAAMALAYLAGATPDDLRHGVESFAGVHRRFDIHIRRPELIYIDDYAHHPQELAATIRSVRLLYPDSHVIAAFQPHLYSRTRDFVDDFARVLSQLDEVALLPIYPAREEPIAGVTSEWLMTKIHTKRVLASPASLPKYLRLRLQQCREAGQKLVVLTMGAGDIDRLVAPITRNLTYKIF
jgi:UDP-N-acetylmuramate--alanine ligase